MDEAAFGAYWTGVVEAGYLCMSIALGQDTGLYKTMCAMDAPATAAEIADAANLKER
jgi:hypothetical protein